MDGMPKANESWSREAVCEEKRRSSVISDEIVQNNIEERRMNKVKNGNREVLPGNKDNIIVSDH